MDFAARITTAAPGTAGEAAPTDPLLIRHHRTGAAEVAFAVPSGGHLLHLALATCVFNDLHGAAAARGTRLGRVEVRADGSFDDALARSTGIVLDVEAEAEGAAAGDLDRLVREVVDAAVIVRIVRASADVRLASVVVRTTPPAA